MEKSNTSDDPHEIAPHTRCRGPEADLAVCTSSPAEVLSVKYLLSITFLICAAPRNRVTILFKTSERLLAPLILEPPLFQGFSTPVFDGSFIFELSSQKCWFVLIVDFELSLIESLSFPVQLRLISEFLLRNSVVVPSSHSHMFLQPSCTCYLEG